MDNEKLLELAKDVIAKGDAWASVAPNQPLEPTCIEESEWWDAYLALKGFLEVKEEVVT